MKKPTIFKIAALCFAFVLGITPAAAEELVGGLGMKYTVTGGKLTATVDLPVMGYHSDMQPNLSISLNETFPNSVLGVGASFNGFGEVTVCAASDKYDGMRLPITGDGERYCLNGKRLLLYSGQEGVLGASYRFEHDDNTVVELGYSGLNKVWVVYLPSGYIAEYGSGANASNDDQTRWKISSLSDRFGNAVYYSYRSDTNFAPDKIEYGPYEIKFVYEARSDVRMGYQLGSQLSIEQRVAAIQQSNASGVTGQYKFTYDAVTRNQYSRLKEVTWCAGAGDNCYPPVKIDYATLPGWVPEGEGALTWKRQTTVPLSETPAGAKAPAVIYVLGDVNSDGLEDICYTNSKVYCALNNGEDYNAPTLWSDTSGLMYDTAGEQVQQLDKNGKPVGDPIESNPAAPTFQLMNLNGDVYLDACFLGEEATYCALNENGQQFGTFAEWSNWHAEDRVFFANINGDEYTDQCIVTGPKLVAGEDDVLVPSPNTVDRPQNALSCRLSTGNGFSDAQSLLTHDFSIGMAKYLKVPAIPPNLAGFFGSKYSKGEQEQAAATISADISGYATNWSSTGLQEGEEKEDFYPHSNVTVGLTDINADGIADFCGADAIGYGCYLGTSAQHGEMPTFSSEKVYWTTYGTNWGDELTNSSWRLVDLNGDKAQDFCVVTDGLDLMCGLNTTESFEEARKWTSLSQVNINTTGGGVTLEWQGENEKTEKIEPYSDQISTLQFIDITQDGNPDLCAMMGGFELVCAENQLGNDTQLQKLSDFEYYATLFGMQDVYTSTTKFGKKGLFWDGRGVHYGRSLNINGGPMRLAGDLDGDGYSQLCYRGATGIHCNEIYHEVFSRITGMEDAYGNRIDFKYGSYQAHDAITGDSPEDGLLAPGTDVYGVVETTSTDAEGKSITESYRLGGLGFDLLEGNKGFRVAEVISHDGTVSRTEFGQSGVAEGQAVKITQSTNGKKIKEETYHYVEKTNLEAANSNIARRWPEKTYSKQWSPEGKLISNQYQKVNGIDAEGNITKLYQTNTVGGVIKKTWTNSTFYPSSYFTGKHLYDKTKFTTVTHETTGQARLRRQSQFYYHEDTGALKQTRLEPADQLKTDIKIEYDDFGNKIKESVTGVSDADGKRHTRSKNWVYDIETGLQLESESNALGHTTTYSDFDPVCNVPRQITDLNGLKVKQTFNAQCQKIKETQPTGEEITYATQWIKADSLLTTINLSIGEVSHLAVRKTTVSSNRSGSVETYHDSLNRTVRIDTQTSCEVGQSDCDTDGTRIIREDSYYNDKGQRVAKSHPYFASAGVISAGFGHPHGMAEYDDYGRPVKEWESDGPSARIKETSYSHVNGSPAITVTAPNGNTKQTVTGVHGKPMAVYENGKLAVSNTYNSIGELTKVDSRGFVVENEYDAKGNRTKTIDPSMGTWEYRYNAFNELVWQKDANGNESSISYDKLGRVTQKSSPDNSATYTYDVATGTSKGKLVKVSNASATESFEFDDLGRKIKSTKKIGAKQFVTEFTYDANGRLEHTHYPEYEGNVHQEVLKRLSTKNHYDKFGRLQKVTMPVNKEWKGDYKILNEMAERLLTLIESQEADIAEATRLRDHYQGRFDTLAASVAKYRREVDNSEAKLETVNEKMRSLQETAQNHMEVVADLEAGLNSITESLRRVLATVSEQNGILQYTIKDCQKYKKGQCTRSVSEDFPLAETIMKKIGFDSAPEQISAMEYYSRAVAYYKSEVAALMDEKQGVEAQGLQFDTSTLKKMGFFSLSLARAAAVTPPKPDITSYVFVGVGGVLAPIPVKVKQAQTIEEQLGFATITQSITQSLWGGLEYGWDPYEEISDQLLERYENYFTKSGNYCDPHPRLPDDGMLKTCQERQDEAYAAGAYFWGWGSSGDDQLSTWIFDKQRYVNIQKTRDGVDGLNLEINTQKTLLKAAENSLDTIKNSLASQQESLLALQQDTRYDANQENLGHVEAQLEQLRAEENGEYIIWAASEFDAHGRLTGDFFGSGVTQTKRYNTDTGMLESIQVNNATGRAIQDLAYTYDLNNNVKTRQESVTGEDSSFTYDGLDRLSTASLAFKNAANRDYSYSYDDRGNITYKSDVGTYLYDDPFSNRLDGIERADGTTQQFDYDNNGNMLTGRDGQIYDWYSFNKASRLQDGEYTTLFEYDGDNKKVRTEQINKAGIRDVWHVGPHFEYEETVKGELISKIMRHSVIVGGKTVMVLNRSTKTDPNSEQSKLLGNGKAVEVKQADDMNWLLYDALGSMTTSIRRNGEVISRHAYDPFGQRIDLYGNRGANVYNDYAMQQSIGQSGLIDMKARVYDPVLGRFLSPDTFIPEPSASQSYNRYSYVYNNPLKYNDPTGHFPFLFIIGLVISVASAFSNNKYIRMIGGIFGMMMMGGVNPFSGSFALTANATARIAAGAFLTTFIVSNGDFGAAMVSGITSFVTAQFSMSIGGIPESSGFFGSLPGKAILHGLVGGVASAVGGGKFGSGFIGSFMGKLGGAIGAGWAKALQLADNAAVTFRTTVAAVFGGMAAKASGGNFAQGAKTAAIQHLFNKEMTEAFKKSKIAVQGVGGQGFVDRAVNYLSQHPNTQAMIEDLAVIDDLRVNVVMGEYEAGYFDSTTNTIYWNPHHAISLENGGSLSPAMVLGHELAHAHLPWYRRILSWQPSRLYTNMEEAWIINNWERPAAAYLGESLRYSHTGFFTEVGCVTCRPQ